MNTESILELILGKAFEAHEIAAVDLSSKRLLEHGVDPLSNKELNKYIYDGRIRYGGYGEHRSLYRRSESYGGEEPRCIHLGIDIWAVAGTKVFAPSEGIITSAHNNAGYGDYGPTLILSLRTKSGLLHCLYGHLSTDSIRRWTIGQRIEAGACLGEIGGSAANGNWPPHLHFQVIKDLPIGTYDYPGVCTKRNWPEFRAKCPDPFTIDWL